MTIGQETTTSTTTGPCGFHHGEAAEKAIVEHMRESGMVPRDTTDKMRWRYGDTNPVVAAVDADTEIRIGDLLWQDVDDAKPAHMAPNRGVFRDNFLGVAMQRSRAGDTEPIRVGTTGVFEFNCRADIGPLELGTMIRPDCDGAGLFSQRVDRAVVEAEAIGRVARREPIPCGSVLIDIRSTVMTGGV